MGQRPRRSSASDANFFAAAETDFEARCREVARRRAAVLSLESDGVYLTDASGRRCIWSGPGRRPWFNTWIVLTTPDDLESLHRR